MLHLKYPKSYYYPLAHHTMLLTAAQNPPRWQAKVIVLDWTHHAMHHTPPLPMDVLLLVVRAPLAWAF